MCLWGSPSAKPKVRPQTHEDKQQCREQARRDVERWRKAQLQVGQQWVERVEVRRIAGDRGVHNHM